MSVNNKIDANSFSKEVSDILETYSYKMELSLQKTMKIYGTEVRDYITSESKKEIIEPKNRNKYVNCFVNKKIGNGLKRRLANTEYRLSHLIENGHKVRNQYGGPYEVKRSKYKSINKTPRRLTHNHGMWEKTYNKIDKEITDVIEKTVLQVE